jgi:hypothetical protein
MPEPSDELFALIVLFKIVRLTILDSPFLSAYPAPMPEPSNELLALIVLFKIVKVSTADRP